jgi:hypothetical protein
MSKIYNYSSLSKLPIPNNEGRTRKVYLAFRALYDKNCYWGWCESTNNTYILLNDLDGFLIDNIKTPTSSFEPIKIFATGNNESIPCTHDDIALRKKGCMYNIKRIKRSKFMYDTKYKSVNILF